MRTILFLTPFVLIAGCAKPLEGRVAEQLVAGGLSEPVARCMAQRWTDRLSVLQLRRIAATADAMKDAQGRITLGRFVTAIQGLDDPEIKVVVTRSAAICALTA